MGHYGGKPREGERAGASNSKKEKEMRHGRLKNESPKLQSREDRRGRIQRLKEEISQQRDPVKREPLYTQFANAVASCPPEVYLPDEIGGVDKASVFYDNDAFRSLSTHLGLSAGSPLPLHHLVKIMAKDVFTPGWMPAGQKDSYIYIIGMQKPEDEIRFELGVANLRALEASILGFSHMILPGRSFELEVNGKGVQVPYSNDIWINDHNLGYKGIQNALCARGIRMAESYTLGRINDGGHKVGERLHLITEIHHYREDTPEKNKVAIAVSYLRLK